MPRRPTLTAVALCACAAALTACGGGGGSTGSTSTTTHPSGPFTASQGLYLNPYTQALQWLQSHAADARAPLIRSQISTTPVGVWFGGWESDVRAAVDSHVTAAQSAQSVPVLVAYHIPYKDCAAGAGASSALAYTTWISGFTAGIGNRPAVVILEPDALAGLDCLPSDSVRSERTALLNQAVQTFARTAPNTWVYVDIGNARWLSPQTAAQRLIDAGISSARGFSINVAGYFSTPESTAYGQAVATALAQRSGTLQPFVIDTGRNGADSSGSCDNTDARLGEKPAHRGEGAVPEMHLWIKPPGESDGCAAPGGQFLPDRAYLMSGGLPVSGS